MNKKEKFIIKNSWPDAWYTCKSARPTLCFLCLLFFTVTALKTQTDPLEANISAEPLACYGNSNGQISFSIEGGMPPYQYSWSTLSNSFVFAQGAMLMPTEQITVGGTLSADAYLLRTEDAEGQIILDTFYLTNPPQIQIVALDIGNSNCGTNCDGYITMDLEGGTGMLTTSWSDTALTGPNRTGLCANEYVFIISDENGCTQKGVLPVEGPSALQIETELSMPSCMGAENGAISVEANGGTGEYTFSWSSGQQQASLSGLAAGSYQVSLTDANGCSTMESYILADGPPLVPNLQINYGCGDGRVVVSTQPVNGSAPYTYQWSTGQESAVIYAMTAGDYNLSMQDANGCATDLDFTINYVAPLTVEAEVNAVSCFDAADGQINLAVSGGQPPFNISWSNGQSGTELSSLPGGEYLFNLNTSGCGVAQLVNVPEPSELTTEVLFTPSENNNLSGTAFISGGTAPYLLEWSTGSTSNTVHNLLPETTYTLWVQDAHQCMASFEVIARLTGIEEEMSSSPFKLYPNPTPGLLWLESADAYWQAAPYQIYSSSGQLILTGQLSGSGKGPIDLRAIPAGIYYLRLQTEGQVVLRKVIKT